MVRQFSIGRNVAKMDFDELSEKILAFTREHKMINLS